MNHPSLRLAFAAALMLLTQLAHAQYSWIDDKGTRVFSDRPPPPETPSSRVLQAPRQSGLIDMAPAAEGASASASASASGSASAPAAPDRPKHQTVADREADYKKRQAERQKEEKKAQNEAAAKSAQQANCAAARQEQAELASGMRISEMKGNGEPGYISDEERASRLARSRQALADCP